jgi:hypothetical protein
MIFEEIQNLPASKPSPLYQPAQFAPPRAAPFFMGFYAPRRPCPFAFAYKRRDSTRLLSGRPGLRQVALTISKIYRYPALLLYLNTFLTHPSSVAGIKHVTDIA